MDRRLQSSTKPVFSIVAKLSFCCAFCLILVPLNGGDKEEIVSHHIDSPYQKGSTTLRVLVPDNYSEEVRYRVVYVLPVREQGNRKSGDGLMEVLVNDFHNRYNIICVAPGYTHLPWYADHSLDNTKQDESHLLKTVLPFVDANYSTVTSKEGRLLLGFSKSGWGALTLLLRNPEVFHRAAGWDIGIRMDTEHLEDKENKEWIETIEHTFGDLENFEHYRVSTLLKQKAESLGDESRIFYYNREGNRGPGGAIIHSLMVELGIHHLYWYEPFRKHRWDSGWLPDAVRFLVGGANDGALSLRHLLTDPDADWERPAITTFGPNNHSIRSEHWRYIRYDDGSEELYDHRKDQRERVNLAANPEHRSIIKELSKWIPETNAPIPPGSGGSGTPLYAEFEKKR